ncbi:riboflavin synthase subunit alpha [Thalassotalea insulae]|uniref:Riboflavin synthase n=1 Tax=Thalassotalea insulae TaxID=2056778 RepID=A0ABQ6GYU3_9GAMM|nr:riboflavin synthase subunit alpha [Thalassotalea insulae]GLX80494.1 riboflavin synthase subunit alpha [Thalassotalea insulae]
MFTGIVQSQATVFSFKTVNNLARLVIKTSSELINNLENGASIAVNGVCLTVVEFAQAENNSAHIAFDIIKETLAVSNLATLIPGNKVNIERSLKVGDELGGHIVSGHVHCQAALIAKESTATNCTLTFELASQWQHYVLAKGFIAINGISLTVGQVNKNASFTVHLIPETLARTNLSDLCLADKVNLEFDQQTITIVTTIERLGLTLN